MDDWNEKFRVSATMYELSKTAMRRRRSQMVQLDQLIKFAEEHGIPGEYFKATRDCIFDLHARDEPSRVGLGEHHRRAGLAAGMGWLMRSGMEKEPAAREALRLGKIRDVSWKQLIKYRDALVAPRQKPGVHFDGMDVARERFARLTNPNNWHGPGCDNPKEIAKRILQALV